MQALLTQEEYDEYLRLQRVAKETGIVSFKEIANELEKRLKVKLETSAQYAFGIMERDLIRSIFFMIQDIPKLAEEIKKKKIEEANRIGSITV